MAFKIAISRRQRHRFRMRKTAVKIIGWSTLLYFAVIVIGLFPINWGFRPVDEGIDVAFVSSAIHADIVLPIQSETLDWRNQFLPRQFVGLAPKATHIAIGWGDHNFFTQVQSISDIRVSQLFKVLFIPSDACLHVSLTQREFIQEHARIVTLSMAQYEQLVDYIRTSFRLDSNGQPIPIPNAAHGNNDAFFEAHGGYHLFNTCNNWVGGAIQKVGITTGWFTPLPKTVLFYLPR